MVRQLLDAGRPVRAAVRREDAVGRLRDAGAEAVVFDLTSSPADVITAAFTGCDAVINAAAGTSVSGRKARKMDRDGVIAAIGLAEKAGVRRWVQISMMGSDSPKRIPIFLRGVAAAKGKADDHLAGSGLTWTVIRPPWLTGGAATGRITVGKALDGGSLSRADLAAVAVACLDQQATHHRLFDLSGGGVPMDEALASVADLG